MADANFQVKKGLTVPRGTASTPSIIFDAGDTDTGVYSPGANQLAISTNGVQALYINSDGDILVADGNRMEIDEIRARDGAGLKLFDDGGAGIFVEDGGNVGVGTSNPGGKVQILQTSGLPVTSGTTQTHCALRIAPGGSNAVLDVGSAGETGSWLQVTNRTLLTPANSYPLLLNPNGGNVGIKTTSPGVALHVDGDIRCDGVYGETDTNTSIQFPGSDVITFNEGGSEAARIDSSGRLLVGTPTARSNFFNGIQTSKFQVEGTDISTGAAAIIRNSDNAGGPTLHFAKSRGTTVGSNTLAQADDATGLIAFSASDGSEFVSTAYISSAVDGTPGADDMPGRLVFSVTADGSASPTEALRISNDRSITVSDGGDVVLGTTTGTKIGTATSQKIGFYNATPVIQPTAVADITTTATSGSLPTPDGSVTIADATTPTVTELLEYCVELEAKLEAALGRLRTLGLIAT